MKKVASDSQNDSIRESILRGLGVAVATRPLNLDKIRLAMDEVKKVGGEELVVEMAATAGAFNCITLVVDASCRKTESDTYLGVARTVMTILKHRRTIGLISASVVTAFVASRLVKR